MILFKEKFKIKIYLFTHAYIHTYILFFYLDVRFTKEKIL